MIGKQVYLYTSWLLLIIWNVSPIVQCVKVTLLHSNDFHTRFIPVDPGNNAQCSLNVTENDHCVGGAARTVALVKEYRTKYGKNLLFLNAGDHFQGTFWYVLKKSEVVANFVGRMDQDEMALGNHEFDDGEAELGKFIDVMEKYKPDFKFVCCNINLRSDSVLNGRIKPSQIRVIDGAKVAIIGYVTPDTSFLSSPGAKVTFVDEIGAIKAEMRRLKEADPTLNIFIAVGHSGLERDREIARAIPELDVVVGGHSHTFLYASPVPQSLPDVPEDEYPIVYRNNGSTTLVVQAFAFGKYMGHLDLIFDVNGELSSYKGFPIYMNGTEDPDTAQFLRDEVTKIGLEINKTVAYTTTELDNSQCRLGECEIGNLVSDAFAALFRNQSSWQGLDNACDNVFGIINGGTIRSSIGLGRISHKDIIDALPYMNALGLTQLTGQKMFELFNHSATQMNKGGFLQMSGIVAAYTHGWDADTATLSSVKVNCSGTLTSLMPNANYLVVTSSYIFTGGDNYQMFDKSIWVESADNGQTALISLIANRTIAPQLENRIVFVAENHFKGSNSDPVITVAIIASSILVALLLLVAARRMFITIKQRQLNK